MDTLSTVLPEASASQSTFVITTSYNPPKAKPSQASFTRRHPLSYLICCVKTALFLAEFMCDQCWAWISSCPISCQESRCPVYGQHCISLCCNLSLPEFNDDLGVFQFVCSLRNTHGSWFWPSFAILLWYVGAAWWPCPSPWRDHLCRPTRWVCIKLPACWTPV